MISYVYMYTSTNASSIDYGSEKMVQRRNSWRFTPYQLWSVLLFLKRPSNRRSKSKQYCNSKSPICLSTGLAGPCPPRGRPTPVAFPNPKEKSAKCRVLGTISFSRKNSPSLSATAPVGGRTSLFRASCPLPNSESNSKGRLRW